MKVLVTGGAGFVGSNLAVSLQDGNEVSVLDNFSSTDDKNLEGFDGNIINGDIRDSATIAKISEPDIIFHQAAITDTTITDQGTVFSVNVEGFRNVLDYAITKGINLVYASSAGVYGNGPVPMKEGQSSPLNSYGSSKLAMDNLAKRHWNSGIKIIGLRYFNVFGPRELYKKKAASMIYQLALQMAADKRPKIFKYGEQMRDHIYVKDVVQANVMAMKAKESCIVNVGTGKATSFNDVVAILNEVLGKDLEPEYIDNPYKNGYQNNTQASTENAQKLLGFKSKYTLQKAVQEYLTEIGMI
ncbi:MAG: ADP-glyceromanno-heptose 6-epimerase [Candidatus Aenigmarchaeota archaeon]|nr:ADP-glyceromanno-heptose 6-epimerase [Candidatus Aenigmarchaeota archaeon]